ncbi:MAG: hypothetical protein DRO52_00215 [Candidatus Hecatellales archaeon]|nr:MAG: hypothetical protein DRO52_00215 [Candidatus Hecatellales archaeon]
MRIADLEIPEEAKRLLAKHGYEELYPPQEEAVRKGALEGRNLVLASPTASGKTLVAELCALKHVLERGGKVLYLTPLRALASEKFADFKKYAGLGKAGGGRVRVALSTGDYDSSDPHLARYDIIIATNEKADSLMRHRAHWLGEDSLLVAAEVHLLHTADRGPTLEVALTRMMQVNPEAQILALSATIENAEEIAEWIGADWVSTSWRPVPLREGVLYRDEIIFRDGSSRRIPVEHSNPSINLALQTVKGGGQALIFTETRRVALNLALKAGQAVSKTLSKSERRILRGIAEEILSVGEKTSLSEALAKAVADGACAHHAGIHSAHRRIIEENFRRGFIKVLAATPTLAAGVNLPARTVIINSYLRYEPGLGRFEIPILEYKQMAGRAGRPRYDEAGEAILVAQSRDEQEFLMEYYICSRPERIWSKLAVEKALRTHVLAVVASGFAWSEQGVHEFFSKTFYAHQYGESVVERPVAQTLGYLTEKGLLAFEGARLRATPFGKRTSELYIDPVTAVTFKEAFHSGRGNPSSPIALLHLVASTPDMAPKLYPSKREIPELQNLLEEFREDFLLEPPEPSGWRSAGEALDYEAFLAELKCVKVLHAWISEVREAELLEKYKVEPGDLYRLVERAEWLLYAAGELAKLFKKKQFVAPLAELRLRVKHGVKAELLPLASLEGVGRIRARALYAAGFRSLEDLRRAQPAQLLAIPGIGGKLARRIKEQVGGLVRKEELEEAEGKGVQHSIEPYVTEEKAD